MNNSLKDLFFILIIAVVGFLFCFIAISFAESAEFFHRDSKICYHKWEVVVDGNKWKFETDKEKDAFVGKVDVGTNTVTVADISPSASDLVTSTVCKNFQDFRNVKDGTTSDIDEVLKKEIESLLVLKELEKYGITKTETEDIRQRIGWLVSLRGKKE